MLFRCLFPPFFGFFQAQSPGYAPEKEPRLVKQYILNIHKN